MTHIVDRDIPVGIVVVVTSCAQAALKAHKIRTGYVQANPVSGSNKVWLTDSRHAMPARTHNNNFCRARDKAFRERDRISYPCLVSVNRRNIVFE
jgi:hypothetical protein